MVYVSAALGTGIVFIVLSVVPVPRAPLPRLMIGTGAGAILAAGMALAFPECLRGPYGQLDPWLTENWIDKINEALPLWTSVLQDPVYPLAVAVP